MKTIYEPEIQGSTPLPPMTTGQINWVYTSIRRIHVEGTWTEQFRSDDSRMMVVSAFSCIPGAHKGGDLVVHRSIERKHFEAPVQLLMDAYQERWTPKAEILAKKLEVILEDAAKLPPEHRGLVASSSRAIAEAISALTAPVHIEYPFVVKNGDAWSMARMQNGEVDPTPMDVIVYTQLCIPLA